MLYRRQMYASVIIFSVIAENVRLILSNHTEGAA